jgi:hypothetical protein
MQKKSVLGTDPFKWLKENNKKENTENPKSDIDGQEKRTEKPLEPKHVDGISAKSKIQEAEAIDVSNIEKALKKTKYEPVGVSGTNKLQEEKADEPSDITEAHRKVVLGEEVYDYHAKSRETTQKDSPATAFVIVYTVLLLILGFIVYRDLTKQIDRLETKLEIVEKQLDAGLINYEDTKLNDVW